VYFVNVWVVASIGACIMNYEMENLKVEALHNHSISFEQRRCGMQILRTL